ncbi:MAG TPA: hypothetical protein VK937_09400 [Candidatus Limnocylindria bacterium]|jgi:hypothetical protein|nr:hypothetical protein [Candidatus Limnocylindria bacterium]
MFKGIRFLFLAAAFTILVSVFAHGFAQDSFTGGRGVLWPRRAHFSGRAKAPAQSSSSSSSPVRDAQAVSLANQALKALIGGVTVTDSTVQATASFIAGSDRETGTATLEGHTGYESRIVLSLSGGQRLEIHNASGAPPQGKWAGSDGVWHSMPLHGCWIDPTWFFPALTIQSALNDPQISLTYLGQGTKAGVAVQHIQISRLVPGQTTTATSLIQRLSQVDMYLDSTTNLPMASDFNFHPDTDASLDLPVEVQFSGWQLVNGFQVPSRIQKSLQGSLTLDLSGVTISVNTGLPQSDFTI